MPPFDASSFDRFFEWLEKAPAAVDTVNLIDFELTGPNNMATTYHGYLEPLRTQVGTEPMPPGPDIPLMALTGARGFGIPQNSFTNPAAFVALHFGVSPSIEIRAGAQVDATAPFDPSGVGKVQIDDQAPPADLSLTLHLTQDLESPVISPLDDPQKDFWKWQLQLSLVALNIDKKVH